MSHPGKHTHSFEPVDAGTLSLVTSSVKLDTTIFIRLKTILRLSYEAAPPLLQKQQGGAEEFGISIDFYHIFLYNSSSRRSTVGASCGRV